MDRSKKFALKPEHKNVLLALVPLGIVVVTHVLNPLLVSWIGNRSPFLYPSLPGVVEQPGDTLSELRAEFIGSRTEAYERAMGMVRSIAREKTIAEEIVNYSATQWVSEQPSLYSTIATEISKNNNVMYTRIGAYEYDPSLGKTRSFLEKLGTNPRVRVIVTTGRASVPSCFITARAALLGFNGPDQRIARGLHIEGPPFLVSDLRTVYQEIISDSVYSVLIKDFGPDHLIPKGEVESVLRELEKKLLPR